MLAVLGLDNLPTMQDASTLKHLLWVQEHLLALHKKLEFVRSNELAAKSAAMQDIAPELERLRAKAVIKSRDLLMARSDFDCNLSGQAMVSFLSSLA